VLHTRLAWRLRLHSCAGLSEQGGVFPALRAPFQQTVVRSLVQPRRRTSGGRTGSKYSASVVSTGATFGSTCSRIADQPYAPRVNGRLSWGLQSFDAAFVHGCETRGDLLEWTRRRTMFTWELKEVSTIIVNTFVRAVTANECVFVCLLHSWWSSIA